MSPANFAPAWFTTIDWRNYPGDLRCLFEAGLSSALCASTGTLTGDSNPGHWTHLAGMTEFTRRQTEAQLKASAAQMAAADAEITAANAATKAAEATVKGTAAMERNANYMFWSVVFAAVSAGASALAAIISARNVTARRSTITAISTTAVMQNERWVATSAPDSTR